MGRGGIVRRGAPVQNTRYMSPAPRIVSPPQGRIRSVAPQRPYPQQGLQRGQRPLRPAPVNVRPMQRGGPVVRGRGMVQQPQRGMVQQRGVVQPRVMAPQRGMVQQRGIVQPRGMIAQRGGRGAVVQPRGMAPHRGVIQQRGPVQARGVIQQRGVIQPRGTIRPRGPMAPRGVINQGGMRTRQPAPQMRGNYAPVQRQPVIVNQARGRGRARYPAPTPVRQQQAFTRGQPVVRPRQRGRGAPRPPLNPKNSYSSSNGSFSNSEDDIIIPTLNSGYGAGAPDFDIIADHEIKHFDGRQRPGSSKPAGSVTQEEQANLARLPQFIQIEKVVEHEVVDLD